MNFLNRSFLGACGLGLAGLFGLLSLGINSAAGQQGLDCNQLLGQIHALDRSNASSNPYADSLQRQRGELDHAVSYAHSIGCDRQQFLFFGSPPPPQCGQLNSNIQRLRANVSQLQANVAASNNTPQRQALVARYNGYCRQQQPKGFLESLFGGGNNQQTADIPQGDLPPVPPGPAQPTGGAEALCVRTCDGGFFPLVYSSRHVGSDALTELCKASCPNTEVKVYTRIPGQEVKTAVGLDGTPYMSLPAALKFEKSYDPACTCKPANEPWAQALAGAERVLGHEGRGDIIVTPEKSAELSRPKPEPAAKKGKAGPQKAGPKMTDDMEAHDAASAAQVPTASNDSSGIAAGDLKPTASFPQGQGKTVEVTEPDGSKRQVRIVGPQP